MMVDLVIANKIEKKIIKKLAEKSYAILILISRHFIFDIIFSTINPFISNSFEAFNSFWGIHSNFFFLLKINFVVKILY